VGLPCPICEYRIKRAKEGADRDELRALKTSSRNLYAVIPRKDKEMDETIHIWNTSQFFVQDAINNELEEDEELYEFPDLENGYRLNIRFDEESFMGNKYYRPSRIDFDDRDPLPPSVLDNVPKLDDCLSILSYAELSAMLFQIDTDDVEIEDDCEVEETRPRRRRKSVVVEEDENEEMEEQEDFEEDENEEIEEKTPPRRRRKSVIKEVEVEEEQEEEEDVEEQEEEKPRKVESAKGSNRIRERKTAKVTEEPEIEEESNETTTKCPFGHHFGIDNDKVPKDCNKCDVWDDCYDAFFEGEE
jgi:flagellar biosynthesis GTPase FlhF